MNAAVQMPETEEPQERRPVLPLREIEKSTNIEPLLTEALSDEIGRNVVASHAEDKESRAEWERRTEAAMKLALQIAEKKNTPWAGASNVKFPLITIASLQFSARAYPALVKVPDLVSYRVMGEDKTGAKAGRAARISRHMSYQLLDQDEQWEEDTDRMFIVVPIVGCAFKKTYWNVAKNRNCSRLVMPTNLVVHYYAKTIEGCERKTEEFDLYEREIKGEQLKGLFSDKPLPPVGTPAEPKFSDARQGLKPPAVSAATPRQMLEQHNYLDLDGDGYPEPYIVTVDRASQKVLRIVARFGAVETEQSVKTLALQRQRTAMLLHAQAIAASVPPPGGQETERELDAINQIEMQIRQIQQQVAQIDQMIVELGQSDATEPRVLSITPIEQYTKYGFIPSPDDGFYDLGFGALLGPVNDSVNTLINQLIDAGTMQNGSTGFIGKGARIQGGEVRFKPYEWKRVQVAGQTLRDSIVTLPIAAPSAVLFQLLSLLVTYGEKISSVNEAMMGSNPGQNTPAFNMNAMLEQGLQVFNGIFKRLYRSFRKELRKLYVMNRLYLHPIEYYETLDGNWQALKDDYAGDEKDVGPAADPNAFSNMQNMMKAQFLATRAASVAGYNPVAIERRLLESMDIPDVQEIYPVDDQGNAVIKPPPNPEVEMKLAEEQRRALEGRDRAETAARLADAKIAVSEAELILKLSKAQAEGLKIATDQYNALTARLKVHSDALQQKAKAGTD